MKITFLGTGTSQGIPVVLCDCQVCSSDDPRDRRLRSSALISTGDTNVLIDPGPDLRQQLLANNIKTLSAIVLTHEHNDHVIGIDELRPFVFANGPLRIYGLPRVLSELRLRFPYVFAQDKYPRDPSFDPIEIMELEAFTIDELDVQALPALHGKLPILGYRFDKLVYFTDVKSISEDLISELYDNIDVLVINALRRRDHRSHLNLQEALNIINRLKPKATYLTHMSHLLGYHSNLETELPQDCNPAYDGLSVEVFFD